MPRKREESFTEKMKRKAEDIVETFRDGDKDGEERKAREREGRREREERHAHEREGRREEGERYSSHSEERGERHR